MADALEVTLIGMSFVFGAILLLWGMMILVVNLTAEKATAAEDSVETSEDRHELRKQAAAIAVAVMLAQQDSSPKLFPAPPTVIVSAWQAVLRSNKMKEQGFKR